MSEERKEKFLQVCMEEILAQVWSLDRDPQERISSILLQANMGYMALTGSDAMFEELWQGFDPSFKRRVDAVEKPAHPNDFLFTVKGSLRRKKLGLE